MVELSEDELADLTEGNVTASEMAIYIPNDGQINANHYTKALFKSYNSVVFRATSIQM